MKLIKKNIGTFDRVMRLIIGIILIALGLTITNNTFWEPFLVVGGVFSLFQALTSWCIIYHILGKNTCPVEPIK